MAKSIETRAQHVHMMDGVPCNDPCSQPLRRSNTREVYYFNASKRYIIVNETTLDSWGLWRIATQITGPHICHF